MTGQVSIASYGAIKNVHLQQEAVFELKQQLELAKMSEILYNRGGRYLSLMFHKQEKLYKVLL